MWHDAKMLVIDAQHCQRPWRSGQVRMVAANRGVLSIGRRVGRLRRGAEQAERAGGVHDVPTSRDDRPRVYHPSSRVDVTTVSRTRP